MAALETAGRTGGNENVTKASLDAVDGGDAVGVAIFGRVKNSLALQVAAEGLEPAGEASPTRSGSPPRRRKCCRSPRPKSARTARIGAQVEVPTEVLAYLANETFDQIAITRTDDSQLKASLAKATKEKQAPVYTGDEVLRGDVTARSSAPTR